MSYKNKIKLSEFSNNMYSQFGEDGIINKIFDVIKLKYNSCCEFGAVDGFTLSNTANLFTNGMDAILIESNEQQYKKLIDNVKKYNCHCFHYAIGVEQENTLDYIFNKHNLNINLDLLSIDIDGNDYYVWESISTIKPRVVVIEYNPTMPYYVDMVGKYNSNLGCSVYAINILAASKGYFIAAITESNCICIKNEYKKLFSEYELDINKIHNNKHLTNVIYDYSGNYFLYGHQPYGHHKEIFDKDIINANK